MLSRLLTLSVHFRDEPAAAEISPAAANAYLATRGWARHEDDRLWSHWTRGVEHMQVPLHADYADYGRCMVMVINDLAAVENRSPLAVWAEMKEQGT